MVQVLQQLTTNIKKANTRKEVLEGKEYFVVPMVMINEGVHKGSGGAGLYPRTEVAKTPAAWDHKPIVVNHPIVNGTGVSACTPEIIESHKVGLIMNTKYNRKTTKLHSEAYLDVEKLNKVDERIMARLNAGEMVEVSTGVFTDNVQSPGEWNGEEYDFICCNFRPDHLAILPDEKGACSIEDGAGLLRINSAIDQRLLNPIAAAIEEITDKSELTINGLSFSDISSHISDALGAKLGEKGKYWSGWVQDVYNDHVIYRVEDKSYSHGYTVSGTKVTLTGEPTEVQRVTEYKPITNSAATTQEIDMKVQEIVDDLITNRGWAETKREWLMSQDEETLGLIANSKPKAAAKEDEEEDKKKAPVMTNAEATVKETVAAVAPGTVKSLDELMTNASPELRDFLAAGIQEGAKVKQEAITAITANAANTFTVEQLADMPLQTLRAMAALAKPTAPAAGSFDAIMHGARTPNYAAAGGGANPTVNAGYVEEPYVAPTLNFEEAKA